MAYKVFTNGSVLNASEINDNLMKQAVSVFSNAAARTAAITSPVEGQLTYLEDTDRYAMWNGSSWISPFGLTYITGSTFSAQSAIQFNSCFSSEFDNYKVVFSNLVIASGDPIISFQMVSGSTPVTTNTYNSQRLAVQSTGVSGNRSINQTSGFMSYVGNTAPNFVTMELNSPFLAAQTKSIADGNYSDQGIELNYARHANATSYDGIRFILASSTMSGSVRIYGYRNA